MSDNKDNNMNLIELKSVGSMLDKEKGVIYPLLSEDGLNTKYDIDNPISLIEDEVSAEWWESLSDEDYQLCSFVATYM